MSTSSIEKAKQVAVKRGVSVSKLVEDYFEMTALTESEGASRQEEVSERTRYLTGILVR